MNKDMIKTFECPTCSVLMKPPIFICGKGHSCCNSCKKKLKECGLCCSRLSTNRNFSLEKLTVFIEYPCKFEQCDYKALLKNLEEHQTKCTFRPYSCPTGSNCEWNGSFGNMLKHIEEKHKSQLRISNDEGYSLDNLTTNKLILNFDKKLFLFSVGIDANFLNISVERILRNETIQYKFSIRFIDKNNTEELSYTKLCQNAFTFFRISIHTIDFAKFGNQYKAQLKLSRA